MSFHRLHLKPLEGKILQLTFSSVVDNDAGTYTCEGERGGQRHSAAITLDVMGKCLGVEGGVAKC